MAARKAITLPVIALLVSCASMQQPQTAQDVAFLRGCWVAKDAPGGAILSFLRLLPPAPGADTLEGDIRLAAPDAPDLRGSFRFARDGSTAAFAPATSGAPGPTAALRPSQFRKPLAAGWTRASWATAPARQPTSWLVAESDGEHVKIYMHDDPEATERGPAPGALEAPSIVLFNGERDGCD